MLKTLLISILLFFIAAGIAFSASPILLKSGHPVLVNYFCRGKEDLKKLVAAIAEDNDVGYSRVMQDPKIGCLDYRFQDIPKVTARLVEELFVVDRADGVRFAFWSVADITGVLAYTWFEIIEDK